MEPNVGKLQIVAEISVLFNSQLSALVHLPWPSASFIFVLLNSSFPQYRFICVSSCLRKQYFAASLDGCLSNYFHGFSLCFLPRNLQALQGPFAAFF